MSEDGVRTPCFNELNCAGNLLCRAHKAANPDRYPIREAVKKMLPQLQDLEGKYPPTKVHLQVYDGACHVLPMLSFTEPAKHCYRAIASWCKFVTSRHPESKRSADLKAQQDGPHPQLSMSSLDIASRQQSFSTEATPEAPSVTATRTTPGPPVLAPIVIPSDGGVVGRPISAVSGTPGSATARVLSTEAYKTASPAPSLLQRNHSEPQTPDLTSWEMTDGEVSRPTSPTGNRTDEDDPEGKADLHGEIKVPKNIPVGFAGNYEIYSSKHVRPRSRLLLYRRWLSKTPNLYRVDHTQIT